MILFHQAKGLRMEALFCLLLIDDCQDVSELDHLVHTILKDDLVTDVSTNEDPR
jgi:hypothetical protein